MVRAFLMSTIVLVSVQACAYRGPVDNPVAGSLTWFSYVGAEDIRDTCARGAPDRYRFVYNGLYRHHVRTYDVVATGAGGPATLRARAREPANLAQGITLSDPFGPWRGKTAGSPLTAQDLGRLRQLLEKDGFFEPGPRGLRLPSEEFYWVASACVGGRFVVNAWRYPSDRFARLGFPRFLLERDRTGVDFYRARPEDERPDGYRGAPGDDDIRLRIPFEFRLDGDRLMGGRGLFG